MADNEPQESTTSLVPYWHDKLPAPLVYAMRHVQPYPVVGPERAVDHTLRIEIPALADGLSPKEQLATLQALQKTIDMFAERFDYGSQTHEPNQLMHSLSEWRAQRKNTQSHVSDYDYLLLQGLTKFQHKLNIACDKLEGHEEPVTMPLPHTIEIALSHGYHAESQPEEVTRELQTLHSALVILQSAAERVRDRDMPHSPILQQLCISLQQVAQRADDLCGVEQRFEHTLESMLVKGETPMRDEPTKAELQVERLLAKITGPGHST